MRLFSLALVAVLWFAGSLSAGGDKKTAVGRNGNDDVDFDAKVHADKDVVKEMLGIDAGLDLVIVEMKVSPRTDKKLQISPDDFTLLSHKDGQKSAAFTPGQLAGKGAMVLKPSPRSTSGMYGDHNGPSWSGPGGMTGRVGKDRGNSGSAPLDAPSDASVKADPDSKVSPLYKILKEKGLPDRESMEPVSGFLYFPIDGKVKGKELSLIYKGPAGRVVIEFHEPK